MARKSKKLVEEKGILSLPDPVRGPSLLQETVVIVCAFHESDDISRVIRFMEGTYNDNCFL